MRILTLLITLFCAVPVGAGQSTSGKPAQEPFSITITAVTPEVEVGSPVEIRIRLVNNSNHDIDQSGLYAYGLLNPNYQYDVRTENGRPVRPKKLEGPIIGSFVAGSVKQGAAVEQSTVISAAYDLPPGKYFIQLARPISQNPKDGVVKSNKITITVTPKKK